MSYVARGERIFAYQDPQYPNCTPQWTKRSDHRLKTFRSTIDARAWHFCEEVRCDHLYDLMKGSRTCLGIDHCHRYVPLEDLLNILMAQREELLRKELQENQGDSEEKKALLGQIAGLTSEVIKSRNMLREAMHKLENIDEIVNENKKLQCRLRCSEERIRFLEASKKKLESELADLRTRSEIQMDLDKTQLMLSKVIQRREEATEMDEIMLQDLTLERSHLQEKVRDLERELQEAKKKEAEIEALKKKSQSDSLDREEMCKENECYKKKLASMICLERQIQELKKQGRALADKYRRESQKAAEQMNKMNQATKELQSIREERDSLRKRVDELSTYECQFNKLQRKLKRVDAVIEENENLNSKLCELHKLEQENEFLKCRLEAIQEAEMTAAEDKEKIMQLQCAVADQEEEMKDLLCQIERLTSGKHEEELERLRCELYEKNYKLKLCEEQLAEVPFLEAEIDDLRKRLQCCCRDFPELKKEKSSCQKIEVRYPATSTGIRANYKIPGRKSTSVVTIRREEKVEFKDKFSGCKELEQKEVKTTSSKCSDKKEMSCEEVQRLLQSSKGIISCILEDMIEHQKEMEKLEMCNRAMKEEIETLKANVGSSDKDCLQQEINNLKKVLQEKNAEISRLRRGGEGPQDMEEISILRQLNTEMKTELQAACCELKQLAKLKLESELQEGNQGVEKKVKEERQRGAEAAGEQDKKATGEAVEENAGEVDAEAAEKADTEPVGGADAEATGETDEKAVVEVKVEPAKKVDEEGTGFDPCKSFQKEIQDLKMQINALNTLTEELKKENEMLRELQKPGPDFSKQMDEKCALENLLSLLQAELDTFKGQKLGEECEALRNELKRVLELNCQLKALVDCYRQRLDLEKQSTNILQQQGEPVIISSAPNKVKTEDAGTLYSGPDNADVGISPLPPDSAKVKKEPTVTPSGRVVGRGSDENEVKPTKQADVSTQEKMNACEEELKALKKTLAQTQQENETLKNSLKDAERKLSVKAKEDAEKPKSKEDAEKAKAKEEAEKAKAKEEAEKAKAKEEAEKAKAKEEAEKAKAKEEAEKAKAKEEAEKAKAKEEAEKAKAKEEAEKAKVNQLPAQPAGGGPEAAALQERLKQQEAENADKLKKLMEQHEKELADREKKCNENLNAMKAGYETDIRKLTERHKQSVLRLQALHEDELRELNQNYESQLETMHTQSQQAINDVAKGSAAKIHKLVEQHAKEVKNLKGDLTESKMALQKAKENAEAKHAREMQKAKVVSKQKLNTLRESLDKEKKKVEMQAAAQTEAQEEVEELKKKLKEMEEKANTGVCDCKTAKKKQKSRDPTCALDFNEVLEKILEEGLDALTFNEIALVHRKTCCALENIMMNSSVCPSLEPPVGDGCPRTPLLEADKQQLLARIFALENDIVRKQKLTQETIISMEVAIKKERCRLQDLKNSLQNEQQKNSELKMLLSSQSKIELDLKKEKDKLTTQASLHQSLCEEKSRQLEEEINQKKFLEAEVEMLKSKLKQLCATVNCERSQDACQQANHLELMRLKLEQAYNQERRLTLQLDNEAKYRMQLQCQLQAMRQQFKQMVNLPEVESGKKVLRNPLEAKSVKERQNLDQIKEKKNKIKTKSVKKHRK